MGDVLLNGRKPLDWELAAMERGRARLLERDAEQLAGVLTGEPVPHPERPRPVMDLILELGR